MAVLAFDVALSVGWCAWRQGNRIESGRKDFAKVDPHDDGLRFLAWRQWLTAKRNEIIKAGETLESIVFESVDFIPQKNGVYSAHIYGAMWGNLASWCAFHKIDCRGINVATIKKHVTGHGSAAKSLVTARINAIYPHITQHDEADAVAVMLTAQNKFAA